MAEKKKGHDGEKRPERKPGHDAEEAREAAERALRGERSAVPPSDLPDGKHERSHAAHLEITQEKPRTKAEGDLILGVHDKGRKSP